MQTQTDKNKYPISNTPHIRDLVLETMREHPGKSEEEIRQPFLDKVHESPEYHDSSFLHSLKSFYSGARWTMVRRKEAKSNTDAKVKRFAKEMILLGLLMPNGKPMRDCTGTEMAKFGEGYARIARAAGARKVGEALTEKQVRSMMVIK